MSNPDLPSALRDETAMRWSFLEEVLEPCLVVSERMEFVYVNTAARDLVPDGWFGKRCFEVLPVADETCAFHCPKIRAVNEAADIVYCEESVRAANGLSAVFGVGLIPVGPGVDERARAVFLLRRKDRAHEQAEGEFKAQVVKAAERVRGRIVAGV